MGWGSSDRTGVAQAYLAGANAQQLKRPISGNSATNSKKSFGSPRRKATESPHPALGPVPGCEFIFIAAWQAARAGCDGLRRSSVGRVQSAPGLLRIFRTI